MRYNALIIEEKVRQSGVDCRLGAAWHETLRASVFRTMHNVFGLFIKTLLLS